jgi:hypothetical protein
MIATKNPMMLFAGNGRPARGALIFPELEGSSMDRHETANGGTLRARPRGAQGTNLVYGVGDGRHLGAATH